MNKIRVVGEMVDGKKVGAIIDTSNRLEAVKIYIERIEEIENIAELASISIDSDIEYI